MEVINFFACLLPYIHSLTVICVTECMKNFGKVLYIFVIFMNLCIVV
jgi:hypothetical protein